MKELLIGLVMLLIAVGVYSCMPSEEQTDIAELATHDYYLLVVARREQLVQGKYQYVLHEAGKPGAPDNITYESEELWSVGEFVIAIELDEQGGIYLTDLDVTTSMIAQGE